jgi:hypothetical protein
MGISLTKEVRSLYAIASGLGQIDQVRLIEQRRKSRVLGLKASVHKAVKASMRQLGLSQDYNTTLEEVNPTD